MRKCSVCGLTKPLTEFNRHKSYPLGRRYDCRICSRDRQRVETERRKQRTIDWINDRPCYICGKPATMPDHVDNKIRKYPRQPSSISNDTTFFAEMEFCKPICRSCNVRKGHTVDHDWKSIGHFNCKLSPEEANEAIRLVFECNQTRKRVAERFNICTKTLRRILNGSTYLHAK